MIEDKIKDNNKKLYKNKKKSKTGREDDQMGKFIEDRND